jgi:hypothetical protein
MAKIQFVETTCIQKIAPEFFFSKRILKPVNEH